MGNPYEEKLAAIEENLLLPRDGKVPTGAKHTDTRGEIVNLVQHGLGSASIITSKVGTLRAGHYHQHDWHYCYVVSGSIAYFSRPVVVRDLGSVRFGAGVEHPLKQVLISTGDLFFSPPMVEHWMVFLADTIFLTLGGGDRKQEHYEEDLVRLGTPEAVAKLIESIKRGELVL